MGALEFCQVQLSELQHGTKQVHDMVHRCTDGVSNCHAQKGWGMGGTFVVRYRLDYQPITAQHIGGCLVSCAFHCASLCKPRGCEKVWCSCASPDASAHDI